MNPANLRPMVPSWYVVKRLTHETHDTFSLDLAPRGGGEGPRFAPGQFNMLYAYGTGEVPVSISGDPMRPKTLTHTIRNVGAVTAALSRLRRGHVLGLRGPFGTPWPVAECAGQDVLIIAGGIGLAPLRPVIYSLLAARDRYGSIALLYGARRAADLLFQNEFAEWRGRYGVQARVTVDSADRSWRGNVGVVTSLFPRVEFDPAHTIALVCGPEIMMRFAVQDLRQRGIPDERIHITMERNMKCAVGFCGHCQFGPHFICKDGPVFSFDRVRALFSKREV